MSGPSSSSTRQDVVDAACSSSLVSDPTPGIGRSITNLFIGISGSRLNSWPKVPGAKCGSFARTCHFCIPPGWPDQAIRLDQSDPNRVRHRRRLGRDVELETDVGEMAMSSVRADGQFVRGLALTQALGDQA